MILTLIESEIVKGIIIVLYGSPSTVAFEIIYRDKLYLLLEAFKADSRSILESMCSSLHRPTIQLAYSAFVHETRMWKCNVRYDRSSANLQFISTNRIKAITL